MTLSAMHADEPPLTPAPASTQFLRRLLLGVCAGMIGGALIYLAGWWLANGLTQRIDETLKSPFRPDMASLINTQQTIESLANAGNSAGGPIEVQVLAAAVGYGEQGYFNTDLTEFMTLAIGTASQNACLESQVIDLSLHDIAGGTAPAKTCPQAVDETDPARLAALHDQIEARTQALLSALASARVAAGLTPGPAAQALIRTLSWQSTILGLETGQVELVQALNAVKKGDTVTALELAREYSVSSQSDFQYLQQLMDGIQIMAPTIQDWHEAHHSATKGDARWTDVKVAAGDVVQDLSYVTQSASDLYRHMGGVEGAIAPFVAQQRQAKGSDLVAARTASGIIEQHLQSAQANALALRKILLSMRPLTQARIDNEIGALRSLLFSLQIWHLTWGVFAGLIGALIGEAMVRARHWLTRTQNIRRKRNPAAATRRYSDAIFPLAGLMLAMLVGVRLTDYLDDITDTLIAPLARLAPQGWLGYLLCVLVLGCVGTVIGGLAGRFLVPAATRGAIAERDVWLTGTGGVAAGVAVAVILRWIVGPAGTVAISTSGALSSAAYLFALALVGGLFGSLIGATLLSGGPAPEASD